MVSTEVSERLTDILRRAVARPTTERPLPLDVACEGDELREDLDRPPEAPTFDERTKSLPPSDSSQIGARSEDRSLIETTVKNRYLVMKELARGGLSVVYLAHDTELHGRLVVIKVLLTQATHRDYFERKFRHESLALARLYHPSVVGVCDRGHTRDGRPFLVLDFVEGQSLRSLLEPRGMPLPRVARLIRQIGQALTAAHIEGVYHRDLKPENVIVRNMGSADELAILIDFGIATVRDPNVADCRQTEIIG